MEIDFQELIALPKKIIEKNILLEEKNIEYKYPFVKKYYLRSEDKNQFSFLLAVKQSAKKAMKLSLHHMEDRANYGLLRVDYGGRHKNPVEINQHVPEKFKPYAGSLLDKAHIHYSVKGYKNLAWAIPLDDDPFPIKDIGLAGSIAEAFQEFCNSINVKTKIRMQKEIFQ